MIKFSERLEMIFLLEMKNVKSELFVFVCFSIKHNSLQLLSPSFPRTNSSSLNSSMPELNFHFHIFP